MMEPALSPTRKTYPIINLNSDIYFSKYVGTYTSFFLSKKKTFNGAIVPAMPVLLLTII